MAKKNDATSGEQIDLFPHNPEIRGLGITEFKLSGAVITGKIAAATEAYDAAQLTPECWAEAAAMWMLRLLHGDYHKIRRIIDRQHSEYCDEMAARDKDESNGFARGWTTVEQSADEQNVDTQNAEEPPLPEAA